MDISSLPKPLHDEALILEHFIKSNLSKLTASVIKCNYIYQD